MFNIKFPLFELNKKLFSICGVLSFHHHVKCLCECLIVSVQCINERYFYILGYLVAQFHPTQNFSFRCVLQLYSVARKTQPIRTKKKRRAKKLHFFSVMCGQLFFLVSLVRHWLQQT